MFTRNIQDASYVIWKANNNTFAQNYATGAIDYKGSRDDIVINNAINRLTNGGKILIKEGTYDITSAIVVKDNVEVTGSGFGTILKASNFGASNNGIINLGILDQNNINCVLNHLTIDGNKASCTQSDGIRIYSANSNIHNLYMIDCGYIGVRFVENSGNPNKVNVSNCIIKDSGSYNIVLSGNYLKIHNNIISGSVIGIYGGNKTDNIISNNIIGDMSGPGIYIDALSAEIRTIIANNKIYNTFYDAISLYNVSAVTVIGNSIYITGQQGVEGGDGVVTVNGNRIIIIGNSMISTNGGGVTIAGSSSITVSDNSISAGKIYGIGISTNSKYLDIIGNQVYGNGQDGIRLIDTTDSIISENLVINNGKLVSGGNQHGIVLNNSSNNRILANVVRDDQSTLTQIYGIREVGTSDYNIIKDNDISGAIYIITKLGINTKIKNNFGYVTENNVLSDTFAIDSAGIKTIAIAHGLAITPNVQDCYLTILQDTAVDDWSYNLLKIVSTDATNVIAKINVSVASATGRATAKLCLMVNHS